MAQTTEIALLPLKAGQYPDTEGSKTATAHSQLIKTVSSQPGFQRLYWSREHENPDNLRWFLDWDSVDAHKKFMDSADYKPFLDLFGEILEGPPQLWHVDMKPHPPNKALSGSPATEVLHVYFPTNLAADLMKDFEERVKKLVAVIEKESSGFTGFAGGWAQENVEIPGKGEKGKAYCALIGWKSVEDHQAFRETEAFKNNIHLLREAKEQKGMNICHIHAKDGQKP